MTIVATWQLLSVVFVAQFSPELPPLPSSNVTKTAVLPEVYSGLLRMPGRLLLSHEFPCATRPVVHVVDQVRRLFIITALVLPPRITLVARGLAAAGRRSTPRRDLAGRESSVGGVPMPF